jgi:exopolysaccharide biosynthesis polyprenyl glycosylphosphotransferase
MSILSPDSKTTAALLKKQGGLAALSGLYVANILNSLAESAILPKSYFLKHLHIEMRRSDRSNSPLSIALFSLNEEKDDQFNNFRNFLKSVQNTIRETDTIGYMDWNLIGVIFPDTNEKGMQRCIEKIVSRNENLHLSITSATYPDQLFAGLLSEKQDRSDSFPFFYEDSVKPAQFKQLIKRWIDIAGSLFGILLLSPIMLLAALAIKITSEGPVIFKQTRLGKKGIPFNFYKFRSMYTNNDDRIHREYVTNLIQGNHDKINNGGKENPLYKIKFDPRITRVGKFIRRTSIDELPQLFNVFKGEMSLVGPRPPLPYEVEKYKSWHLRRILEVKPGITGLWQVEGRSKTSFDDMVRLDLCYVQNWSLLLDLKILIKTVREVFRSSGAH